MSVSNLVRRHSRPLLTSENRVSVAGQHMSFDFGHSGSDLIEQQMKREGRKRSGGGRLWADSQKLE